MMIVQNFEGMSEKFNEDKQCDDADDSNKL